MRTARACVLILAAISAPAFVAGGEDEAERVLVQSREDKLFSMRAAVKN